MLEAYQKTKIKDLIEAHLRHAPARISRSRIKRLRGLRHPQYRLRIDDFRIFYDIEEKRVEILAIIFKSKAAEWLKKAGFTHVCNYPRKRIGKLVMPAEAAEKALYATPYELLIVFD